MPDFEDTLASLEKHARIRADREVTNTAVEQISTYRELLKAIGVNAATDVAVTMHPLCDLQILELLSKDKNWFVRTKVAHHYLATASLLENMARVERHPTVILEIATHPRLSFEVAMVLLRNVIESGKKENIDFVWKTTYKRFHDDLVQMLDLTDENMLLPERWLRKTIIG